MKQFTVRVHGTVKIWEFTFLGDPKHWPDWTADGLDVWLVCNRVPTWCPRWARKAWMRVQDALNFTV